MQIYAQPRGRGGGGGGYSHFHQNQPHMPATQPAYYYQQRGPVMNQPQRMQPEKLSKRQVFSHDGRDWTTGICGCFEHCASCTSLKLISLSLYLSFCLRRTSAESCEHRTVSLADVVVCVLL